ncbi:hypothetical protein [Actinomadura madurae]|uniref:hypothetical protein n=1 Tax=Actinomadura madurae TaxID=1993 RepID=UPI0020D24130|nr:hypothetical protein [Actinomadura madurae]MCP9981522.1 hypothetical protein [Actinomadura madurae]
MTLLDQGDAFPARGPGPWLVQDRIPGDGWDRKLFVVGPHVHGTLRRWRPGLSPRSWAARCLRTPRRRTWRSAPGACSGCAPTAST